MGAIAALVTGSLFGLSTTEALVILFVILPVALAAVIFPLVAWRAERSGGEKPVLTSDILASGVPGRAQIVSVRPLGSIVDMRPMVSFRLKVVTSPAGEPFDLEVIQSFPRSALRQFRPGDTVEVRLTPDLSRGAVVWNSYA